MSCPYSALFGEPGTGFHSTRFLGIALYDTIGTILIAIVTSYVFKISLVYSIVGWFVAGEVLHYAFGTNSAFLKMIGLSPKC